MANSSHEEGGGDNWYPPGKVIGKMGCTFEQVLISCLTEWVFPKEVNLIQGAGVTIHTSASEEQLCKPRFSSLTS